MTHDSLSTALGRANQRAARFEITRACHQSPLATSLRSRSTQRLEYPHSLSYQDRTFTKSPSITFVYGASTIEEFALPLKSIETSSSFETARMPLSGPSAASVSALLTASGVVFLSTIAFRSTTETFGVGT